MSFEHKPGTFTLFKNDKQGNANRPDYKGEGADLDGAPIRVSAWLKDGKNGKFMSCKFDLKESRPETGHDRQLRKAGQEPTAGGGFDEDPLPF